jgi:argininosuccinate lyase
MPRSESTNDWRLFAAELRISRAWLGALAEAGVYDREDAAKVRKALDQIESERKAYTLAGLDMFKVFDTRLISLVGGSAAKLGAGRSTQERLLTALRFWLIEEMRGQTEKIAAVQKALLTQAESQVAAMMPAYVNLRPAQPISAAHWLLSFFWMLARDQDRLAACIGRASAMPLGSGLVSGSGLNVDRAAIAEALGMPEVTLNSLDAVSDWDFAAEFLFVGYMTATHLSRLAEDLTIYSSPSPGFVTLEAEATLLAGIRGLASALFGQLAGFMVTLKALPSAYNQDAPQNRQMLYMATDALTDLLENTAQVLKGMAIQADRMWEAVDDPNLFTADLVDYLTTRGQTGAELIVKRLQAQADRDGIAIVDMPLSDLQAESKLFEEDVFKLFDVQRSVARRTLTGGTAPGAVREQIRRATGWLMDAGLS